MSKVPRARVEGISPMSYSCPSCRTSFDYKGHYLTIHCEYVCSLCGQDLQWDEPRVHASMTGPPRKCRHRDKRRLGAKIPTFSRRTRINQKPPTTHWRFLRAIGSVFRETQTRLSRRVTCCLLRATPGSAPPRL